MNINPFFYYLVSFLLILSFSVQADTQKLTVQEYDYCYKPSKPLFLAGKQYKNRYVEDMKEYQQCRQRFIEMQQWAQSIEKESKEKALHITNVFMGY
jgi:hypothetical protein